MIKPLFKCAIAALLCSSIAFGATSKSDIWAMGNNIPSSLYWNIHAEDKELTAEIYAGVRYCTLEDNGGLLQALLWHSMK